MSSRIVVGVDGSQGSRRAQRWAIGQAAAQGAVIEAVTVWQNPSDPNPRVERRLLSTSE